MRYLLYPFLLFFSVIPYKDVGVKAHNYDT